MTLDEFVTGFLLLFLILSLWGYKWSCKAVYLSWAEKHKKEGKRMVDKLALDKLVAARKQLTRQQFKTLRGQILSGDAAGAMRGLAKLTGGGDRK